MYISEEDILLIEDLNPLLKIKTIMLCNIIIINAPE